MRRVIKIAHELVIQINGHKNILAHFSELATAKRSSADGTRNWERLVLDNDTRWDTDLMLLERVVYFMAEIQRLYADGNVQIPANCLLGALDFELCHGMVLVLEDFREFTKFVQYRDRITYAYIPKRIDRLLSKLDPDSADFLTKMRGKSAESLQLIQIFRSELAKSLKIRFQGLFEANSLALAAAMLLPGPNPFQFQNFPLDATAIANLKNFMIDDFSELLPVDLPEAEVEQEKIAALHALNLARTQLDKAGSDEDPLVWWPAHPRLATLFNYAKMLFAIPASSAESERSFSSAGFTMDSHRTRLDLETFRMEHRIRRFIVAGTDGATQAGRETRMARVKKLLEHFPLILGEIEAEKALNVQ